MPIYNEVKGKRMKIKIYSGEKGRKKFSKKFFYWSNACGDLHFHGKRDITERELPPELLYAYKNLWSEEIGYLCYLAEYKGKYGIALIGEYDSEFADNFGISMDRLFLIMSLSVTMFPPKARFEKVKVILGEHTGEEGCHELICFLPWNSSNETLESAVNNLLKQYDLKIKELIQDTESEMDSFYSKDSLESLLRSVVNYEAEEPYAVENLSAMGFSEKQMIYFGLPREFFEGKEEDND